MLLLLCLWGFLSQEYFPGAPAHKPQHLALVRTESGQSAAVQLHTLGLAVLTIT